MIKKEKEKITASFNAINRMHHVTPTDE